MSCSSASYSLPMCSLHMRCTLVDCDGTELPHAYLSIQVSALFVKVLRHDSVMWKYIEITETACERKQRTCFNEKLHIAAAKLVVGRTYIPFPK